MNFNTTLNELSSLVGLASLTNNLRGHGAVVPNSSKDTPQKVITDLLKLYKLEEEKDRHLLLEEGSRRVLKFSGRGDDIQLHMERLQLIIDQRGLSDGESDFVRMCCGLSSTTTYRYREGLGDSTEVALRLGQRVRKIARDEIDAGLAKANIYLNQTLLANDMFSSSAEESERIMQRGRLAFPRSSSLLQKVEKRVQALRHPLFRETEDTGNESQTGVKSQMPFDKGKAISSLEQMVGLSDLKNAMKNIVATSKIVHARKGTVPPAFKLHAVFSGNPGTGKTTTARIYGSLLKDAGLLTKGHLVEVQKENLVSRHTGMTQHNTQALINQAIGGVLFVDQAHRLIPSESDSTEEQEAISTLMIAMSSHKDLSVVFSIYTEKADELMAMQLGLRRRIGRIFDFPDFSDEEISTIARETASRCGYHLADDVAVMVGSAIGSRRGLPDFGNAHDAIMSVKHAILSHTQSVMRPDLSESGSSMPRESDRNLIWNHFETERSSTDQERKASLKLREMVGLSGVKKEIQRMAALCRQKKRRNDYKGTDLNSHSVFFGNPGTGKTEVAKMYGQLLYEAGILSKGHVITAGKRDLEGEYVGQTGPKVRKLVERALGGVLLIDDAHQLIEGPEENSFVQEAVCELMQLMLTFKKHFVVVFAAHSNQKDKFLGLAPGLRTRLGIQITFPDYSNEELAEILGRMASSRGYTVDRGIQRTIGAMVGSKRGQENFGNAGDIELLLDEAIKSHAQRVMNAIDCGELHAPDALRDMHLKADDFPVYRSLT